MADGDKTDDFPIVDPHQHFWDLGAQLLSVAVRSKPVHFRYGDYSSLKRNYLPPDYLRDAAGLNIVKTVHEDALWDPPIRRARRAGWKRSRRNTAIRMRASAPRCLRATISSRCSRDTQS